MNDNDKIALSLLAFASMVIWKKRKTDKIGATKRTPISRERRKIIQDAFKGLKRQFERTYGKSKVKKAKDPDSESEYLYTSAGNTRVIIRNADHRGFMGKHKYEIQADLFNLSEGKENAYDLYEETKSVIEKEIRSLNKKSPGIL